MKTMKKSKPKQRTNWKQRALHCEEVIKIQNQVANANQFYWGTAKQYVVSRDGTEYWPRAEMNRKIEEYLKRAESAEKHNHPAVKKLTRSEYDHFVASCNAEAKPSQKLIDLMKSPETLASLPSQLFYPGKELSDKYRDGLNPTHWQRFKSWLGGWYVELLCLMVVICAVAGFVAYAWIRSL